MKRTAIHVVAAIVVFVVISFSVIVSNAKAEEPTVPVGAMNDGVVAFYFHGNVRCATCKKIESYADQAVNSGFPELIEEGTLVWRVINIDEAENKHFVQDFQLVTRSVVLAEYQGGKVVRWQNLDKVWQLVRNKDSFVSYVQGGTKAFLENG